mgnify:FL=1
MNMPREREHPDQRGTHPNSKKNLSLTQGRPSAVEIWGEATKTRAITATETGWKGVREAAIEAGYQSLSEFLEMAGRGVVSLPKKPEND